MQRAGAPARGHVKEPLRARALSKRACSRAVVRRERAAVVAAAAAADTVIETDVVVIGSGIGGLSCGALLAKYGKDVIVCESHDVPGGAAHAWVHPKGYHFEAGPSLYSGMAARGPEANPLAHVFQAIGEPLELIRYKTWNVMVPEGDFLTEVGAYQFLDVLTKIRGKAAADEWAALQEAMKPLAKASALLPPAALRGDLGATVTALGRYFPKLLTGGADAAKLTGSFKSAVESTRTISDPFILNWLDLLSFLLSGLPADGTIAAEVAFMFNEWYRPDCALEFPKGGSGGMVAALVRGLERHGGELMLKAHVDEILLDEASGRACGVRLRDGREVRARQAVVSNATRWDTLGLLPEGTVPADVRGRAAKEAEKLPEINSFMHLHVGFDATGLDDLEMHHIVVNTWDGGVDTEQNVVLLCIASVADPSLAPEGKHVLHAYTPATEPYSLWEGLERGSPEYKRLKEERSRVLWEAAERVIPDIRERADVALVGTPLTHERFLRRHKGSYGPGVVAGKGQLIPGAKTPVPGLYACGDTAFPGIGLPAVAASGMIAANTLVSVGEHWAMLDEIGV
ncbi:unnamed protein product [Pedinophyceae sp. YPF-701]|nr:unnamed protein product [Pedinophyceae sp. YPF-701]